jgi:hypothetical protein
MVELYYNSSINEATTHAPFEVMYGYQPSTSADRLLPMAGATADATDRLTLIADIIRDVVNQLLKLSKERMAARSTRTAPIFQPGDLVYLSSKRLHIRSQKCKHLRDQKLGPYKVISKVGINSYKLLLPKECQLHPIFYCDLFSHATSSTSLRPQAEVKSDHEEYVVDFISDVKIDNWPRRRGPYLQFLTPSCSFDIPEWMLLEQVDDCERLSIFLNTEKWNVFSLGKDYLKFVAKYPMRNIVVHK